VSNVGRRTWIWRGLLSLVVLAVLALTLDALAFSGASFAAGSVSPANVFTAGVLSHTDSLVTANASGLVPGASSVGTMTLIGTGNVPGAFTLSTSSLTNTPATPALSGVLTLKVEDVTGTATTLYQGLVSSFSSKGLGTIAAGASRTYKITLAYPAGTNNASLQGAAMTLVLQVTGVSQ